MAAWAQAGGPNQLNLGKMSRPSPVPPWSEGSPGVLTLIIDCRKPVLGGRCAVLHHWRYRPWDGILALVSGMLLWVRREKRGNTPTSMTHAGADCRADPMLAASYERRQCCWHPETPSQSAGIRGASLVFLSVSTTGLVDMCPRRPPSILRHSLTSRAEPPVLVSTRCGYHRANSTGPSSGYDRPANPPQHTDRSCSAPRI